jgi:hypothetical protein
MTLLQTQYWPSVEWCAAAWPEQEVALHAAENYQKGSLRNRCYIAGPNGPQRLSIPLEKGKHQQCPIREVRISYAEPWQRQHWRSIRTAYGNAPFFEHYADEIRPFYEKKWDFLFDYNLDITEFALRKKLGWKGSFFIAGPGELQLTAPPLPLPKRPQKPYPQVFQERHGFLPNLSVLDLLMCCGKRGSEALRG